MNIDEAKENLIERFHPEYQNYIVMRLAGDFAVALENKFQEFEKPCNTRMHVDTKPCTQVHRHDKLKTYFGSCPHCGRDLSQ